MKYAIFSDVHANPNALRTVLDDAITQGATQTICLGDVVGYGPLAEETVELVRQRVDVCLMGNHDAAVSAVITGEGFSMTAIRGVARHRTETSVESRRWLAERPYVYEGEDFACAHGEFSRPSSFDYAMNPADALSSWAVRRERVLFVGHTHTVALFAIDGTGEPKKLPVEPTSVLALEQRYLVNVGAVGYPRHDAVISYCLYDTVDRHLVFRRLPFDFKGYEKAMRKRDIELPYWFDIQRKQSRSER